MSDEPIIDDLPTEDATKSSEEWVMPKPVFRTTEGRTPKSAPEAFFSDEMPTEIANKDDSAFAKPVSADEADTAEFDTDPDPAVEVAPTGSLETPITPSAPQKGGCAKSFLFIVSMIGLAVAAIIIALVYFFFYYRPAETGTF